MFRIYHRYILRKMLIAFFVSLTIISLCLVSLNLLKMIKHVQHGLSFSLFLTAIGYLNLFILAFSVPLSMLIASLLVFGRMSADNEITASRSSGISLSQIALPPLLLSTLVSFFMLYINGVVSPQAHYNMGRLAFLSGSMDPMSFFKPRESNTFGDYSILVDRIEGNKMFDLSIMQSTGDQISKIKAKSGEMVHEPGDTDLKLILYDAEITIPLEDGILDEYDRILSIEFDMKKLFNAFRRRKNRDDLTIKELIIRRKLIHSEDAYIKHKYIMKALTTLRKPVSTEAHRRRNSALRLAKIQETIEEQERAGAKTRLTYVFEINKRVVLSLSCLAFTLIAIPLGIKVHRRERSVNILAGVLIALAYYAVILIVEKSCMTEALRPHLLIWIPPIVCTLLGFRLFKRLKRGA